MSVNVLQARGLVRSFDRTRLCIYATCEHFEPLHMRKQLP
jgi:hypothetical protein